MSELTSSEFASGGWLVVQRYAPSPRPPSPSLTREAVTARYGGFDGKLWPAPDPPPLTSGLAPPFFAKEVQRYFDRIRQPNTSLLYVHFATDRRPDFAHDLTMEFCGFDYGTLVSEYSHFSSILNEMIYGVYGEMQSLVPILNSSLLFPSLHDVSRAHAVRSLLVGRGAHLETMEPDLTFQAIAIFRPRALDELGPIV